MTAVPLENRTDRLFGRDADLQRLLQRTQSTGLTGVVGQPQIGKSWLLMELARRLDRETDPRCLVGFTRSPHGARDPLLQVVSDLYQRWLADAGGWEQLKAVWEQQKGGLLPAFARFVGKLSEKAGKLVPILGDLGATAIKESLEGLVAASEGLRSGGLIVSRLEYIQAEELVSSVHDIAGRRIALVMDQWEESSDPELQRNAFRDFLREPEQWQDCHILLGAREGVDVDAVELLRELEREFPGGAYVHALGEMDLGDEAERRRVIGFLHEQPQLRALENIGDDRVLGLIGGYPRVISRWVAEDARESARTFDGLEHLARQANEFRYHDLEKLLLGLDGDWRKLALRVALVPLVEDADVWRVLRSAVLDDLRASCLDDLKNKNVLDARAEPPGFGHPTRRDAARVFLATRYREAVRAEAEVLIFALARSITKLDTSAIPYLSALAGIRDNVSQQDLDPLPLALCDASLRLLGERVKSPDSLLAGAEEARRSQEPGVGPVLAGGLYSALLSARAENDLERRDALLTELRALSQTFPTDDVVRQNLSRSLLNALYYSKMEGKSDRCSTLLNELRTIAHNYPDDAAVRLRLARGLLNMVNDFESEGNIERSDAMVSELRELAKRHPDDAAAREWLVKGLFNTLERSRLDVRRRDPLLNELRSLSQSYSHDSILREHFVISLCNLAIDAQAEGARDRYYDLLAELRAIAHTYADDAIARRWFGMTLFEGAKAEADITRREALLAELQSMAHTYADDPIWNNLITRLES
jgi:hypothetical protein